MLLCIGNEEEYHCLQELSDKLRQPICLIPAPEDPMEILSSVRTQYSYYIVNIGSYVDQQKNLIYALKKLVECIEGSLILLAVDMTRETPIISELMYAGFTNIIFGKSSPVCAHITSELELRDTTTSKILTDTVPIYAEPDKTAPMVGESLTLNTTSTGPGNINKTKRRVYAIRVAICGGSIMVFSLVLVVIYYVLTMRTADSFGTVAEAVSRGDVKEISLPSASVLSSKVPELPEESVTSKESPTSYPPTLNTEEPLYLQVPQTAKATVPDNSKIPDITSMPVDSDIVSGKEIKGDIIDTEKDSTKPTGRKTIPIRTISLPSSIRMVIGGSLTIEPEYEPVNANEISLHWYSSDANIATVRNGRIKAIRSGLVLILVETKNGKKAECEITIEGQ